MIINVDPIIKRYEIGFDPEHREHESGRLLHCWRIVEMWKTYHGYCVKYGAFNNQSAFIDIDDDNQEIVLRGDCIYKERMSDLQYVETIIKLKKMYGYINAEKPNGVQINYSYNTKGFKISFENCLCTRCRPNGVEYIIGFKNLHFYNIRSFIHFCTNRYLLKAGDGARISIELRPEHHEIRICVARNKRSILVTYCPSKKQFDFLTDRLKEIYRAFKKHVESGPNMNTDDLKESDKNKRDMTIRPKRRTPRQEGTPEASKGSEYDFDTAFEDLVRDMVRNDVHNEGDAGKKYDSGKRRYDLVDLDVIGAIADILGFGAQKYGENSWQNLPNGEKRYFAALMRHLEAHQRGETVDPESGYPHIYHALTNAYFLTYFYNHREDMKQ